MYMKVLFVVCTKITLAARHEKVKHNFDIFYNYDCTKIRIFHKDSESLVLAACWTFGRVSNILNITVLVMRV